MTSRYKRALVTGGAGFIGSHLARALLAEGLEVVVLDDLSLGKRSNLPKGTQFIEGNICDPVPVSRALEGVDIVFHNAARVSVRASISQYVEDAQVNVFGTLSLLRALVGTRVSKFVLASSMAVYSDSETPVPIDEGFSQRPLSPYGTGKLAAELYALQICAAHGIDVVPLRYFNTYGPGQAFTAYVGVVTIFATKLLRGEQPTIFGDGLQVRDFVSVHDIVQGNLRAMHSDVTGQVFNIGSGIGVSVQEICQLLIAKIAPDISPLYAAAQPGETRNSIANIELARQRLDYQPTRSFERDVDEVIEALAAS
ncbi:MAG: NAD-dependent epimerase/dehydratase family protein [Pirellulaceae bacterium]|nr:NAD-dependent epimerase/dehydratase family protein [Pirellulaceae bacterium]